MAGITKILKKIESFLPRVLAGDRLAAKREIVYLARKSGKFKPDQNLLTRINRLENRLQASVQKRNRRKENLPRLRFNEELPIFTKKDEIIQAIFRHRVIVVSGETGSGKTTQLPKFCLAAGRGIDGLIGCTQPRRIAATSVARRIAEELGQESGNAVGYKIRFRDRSARDAYIKMMTDGILLAETQSDRYLSAYDTIIVDEAHERSLNIDFILGILRTLIRKRDDLKLIITSATIDTEKFSRTFDDAPVIEVSGRMYPVDIQYPEPQADPTQENGLTYVEMAVRSVQRVLRQSHLGDMLVFMPTEQDIRETCELITAENPQGVRVMPLFARLTAAEQSRVFARQPERKIIVATNLAETSITIPGIKYVIDSGLARISRYSPRTRTTSLPVTPVSRSSCDQRKGRCGRVQNGVCIRLFPEDDYETRPQYTLPEILRANLAEVILRMISLKLGDISQFPFIDRPDLKSIKDGFDLLFELGAIKNRLKAQGSREKAASGSEGSALNSEFGMGNSEREKEKGGQRTEVIGQEAEDGGHGVETRCQVSGFRGQASVDRRHVSNGKGQRAESRGQSFEFGIRNSERKKEDRGRKIEDRGQEAESRVLNAECGMRPPAHRGLRLRPGGNAEKEKENGGQKAEDRGQKAQTDGYGVVKRSQISENMGQGVALGGKSKGRVVLTEKGRLMARIPLDPRLSRMLIEAKKEGCIDEITIIVAALSIQDPRERPVEKAQDADRVHATFHDFQSDFMTLLNIWHRYHSHRQKVKSNNQMKRFCREHFLSFMRMREWRDIHHQISDILKEHGMGKSEVGSRPPAHRGLRLRPGGKSECGSRNAEGGRRNGERGMRPPAHRGLRLRPGGKAEVGRGKVEWVIGNAEREMGKGEEGRENSTFEAIHKSVLSGFLSNIAQKKDKNIYRTTKGREVMIFPGSGLFNKAKSWIVAEEMMETSRLFARTVANIDSDWLEALGGNLCRRTYLEPHWEKNRGEVVASEQVSLFGLIIVPDRKVSYGKVNPAEASRIFIQSALVNGDVKKPFAFMKYNLQLIDEIEDIENRFRRRDLLVDEHKMFEFYQEKLPGICDIRSLAKYLKRKGSDRFLRMEKETLLQYPPDTAELIQYPTRLDINRHAFECSYCFDPGKDDDGVTVKVPSALAPSVLPETIDWLVPGLYPEKIEALIKGLPKAYRKKLVPVKNTVDIIVREMPKSQTSLVSVLGDFIYRRFGVDIPAAAWSTESLPDYLKMRISVTAPDGKELRAGRDVALLRHDTGKRVKSDEFEAACRKWGKKGITRWDFGDLPEFVSDSGNKKANWVAYPALETDPATNKSVNLRLFRRQDNAISAHRAGVATLYAIHFSKNLKVLKRQLILPADARFMADYFGGPKKLVQQMYDRFIEKFFAKNIRSEKVFYVHAESVTAKIFPTGRELLDKTIPVLNAYHDARSRITKLQQANRTNSMAVSFFEELTRELERLVPRTFVAIYDIRRLDHLPRYIQAAAIRARRAVVDFEKDRAKSHEIIEFTDGLNQLLKELSPSVSDEKRQAIEAYFWMVEEYKVSVFAQELKTAIPISAKRLEMKLKEIGRMA